MVAEPHDELAEKAVLGAMLDSDRAIPTAAELLQPDDFYRPAHGYVFATILDLQANQGSVTPILVSQELERWGQLRQVGGAPALFDLYQHGCPLESIAAHAQIILNKAKLRAIAAMANRLLSLAHAGTATTAEVDEILAQAEREFTKNKPPSGAISFDELINSWRSEPEARPSIRTPWPELNTMLNGGMQRGRLYTIAARPGAGKSLAALNVLIDACFWGRRSLLFSLEMGRDEVAARILARGATTPLGELLQRRLDLESTHRIDQFYNDNQGSQFYLIDRETITVEQIISEAQQLGPLDVIAVDYLQLVQPTDRRVSREQQVAHMSRMLKIAARQLDCAVVACCQLNRGNVKDNGKMRKPTISDIRESGAIEQDSDCVLLLSPVEDDPTMIDLIVGKNRQGRTGDLQLEIDGRFATLSAA